MSPTQKGSVPTLISILMLLVFIFGIIFYPRHAQETTKSVSVATSTTPAYNSHESLHIYPNLIIIKPLPSWSISYDKKINLPVIRNIEHADILSAIQNKLTLPELTGATQDEIQADSSGITEIDYSIDYDKHDVLSISVFIDSVGAYPSFSTEHRVFNLKNGKPVTLTDIFYPAKIDTLISTLNTKLKSQIANAMTSTEAPCVDALQEQLKDMPQTTYSAEKLNFNITEKGITFNFPYDFPHAIKACEPDQIDTLSYQELKDFIRPDGLLGSEIRQ